MARAKSSKSHFRKSPTSAAADSAPDLYREVTERVIAQLAAGTAPWQQPWNSYGPARNVVTQHHYTGINAFLLNFFAPHPIPYYLTFLQAKALGGRIRRGAKAERVYFFKTLYLDAAGKRITPERAGELATTAENSGVTPLPFLRSFCVFNVADVEGVDFGLDTTPPQHAHATIAVCEEILSAGAAAARFPTLSHEIEGRAYYVPREDVIRLPAIGRFRSPGEYYATLFHELTHSTGHVTRLNRPGVAGKIDPRSKEYAREELIAELGAAFLCAHTGIDVEAISDNHAAYLAGWIARLQEDSKLIFRVAAAAQRATDYLLGRPARE